MGERDESPAAGRIKGAHTLRTILMHFPSSLYACLSNVVIHIIFPKRSRNPSNSGPSRTTPPPPPPNPYDPDPIGMNTVYTTKIKVLLLNHTPSSPGVLRSINRCRRHRHRFFFLCSNLCGIENFYLFLSPRLIQRHPTRTGRKPFSFSPPNPS